MSGIPTDSLSPEMVFELKKYELEMRAKASSDAFVGAVLKGKADVSNGVTMFPPCIDLSGLSNEQIMELKQCEFDVWTKALLEAMVAVSKATDRDAPFQGLYVQLAGVINNNYNEAISAQIGAQINQLAVQVQNLRLPELSEMMAEIGELKAENQELKTQIAELKTEHETEIQEMKAQIATIFATLSLESDA